MKKMLALSTAAFVLSLTLTGCQEGNKNVNTEQSPQTCPANAPMFTSKIGEDRIKQWGMGANANSPVGKAGYEDINVGAAYFTMQNYTSEAVLLPTVSRISRVGLQGIYDYFLDFLLKNPQMTEEPLKGGTTLANCGVGVMSGYYDFMLSSPNKAPKLAHARYTMQFDYQSEPKEVSITVTDGPDSGKVISYTQKPGWYIDLQNSAALPDNHEVFIQKIANKTNQ